MLIKEASRLDRPSGSQHIAIFMVITMKSTEKCTEKYTENALSKKLNADFFNDPQTCAKFKK